MKRCLDPDVGGTIEREFDKVVCDYEMSRACLEPVQLRLVRSPFLVTP
jgi:hypothetical protein